MADERNDSSEQLDEEVVGADPYPADEPYAVDLEVAPGEAAETEDRGIGQLIRPDGDQFVDGEADEVALDLRDDEADTVPAEEAAMHFTAAPPMGDGDGYVED